MTSSFKSWIRFSLVALSATVKSNFSLSSVSDFISFFFSAVKSCICWVSYKGKETSAIQINKVNVHVHVSFFEIAGFNCGGFWILLSQLSQMFHCRNFSPLSEDFNPNISDDNQRLPKTSEDFQGRLEEVSIIHQQI